LLANSSKYVIETHTEWRYYEQGCKIIKKLVAKQASNRQSRVTDYIVLGRPVCHIPIYPVVYFLGSGHQCSDCSHNMQQHAVHSRTLLTTSWSFSLQVPNGEA